MQDLKQDKPLVSPQGVQLVENKVYYPNGKCRGDLTTLKYLSNGDFKGYAYTCKTIQPKGYLSEIVRVEEFKLKASTEGEILNSYLKFY